MDLTKSIEPKSDQLNADDLISGPRVFTVEKVTAGTDEQPVNVHLVEMPGRPWRPSKSMRRILVTAWDVEAIKYVGRRVKLFRDPSIKFGGIAVGGIAVSHLSDLERTLTVALTASRGKRAAFTVEPLPDAPAAPDSASAGQVDSIRGQVKRLGMDIDAASALIHRVTGRSDARTSNLTATEAVAVLDDLHTLDGGES